MSNDDTQRGLYNKYTVTKNSAPEQSFEGFVLNYETDRYSVEALRAYAKACEDEYPMLAADLREQASLLHAKFTQRAIEESTYDSGSPAG